MTGTVTVAAASSGGQATGGTSGAGALQLTAKSLAFSPGSLTAPAGGGQITVHFDNQDPQVPHNLVVFNGRDASSPILFRGPPLTGPGSVDYRFAAPPPGTYFFDCEFHPTTMTGTLTVP
jgi:plastocyanin